MRRVAAYPEVDVTPKIIVVGAGHLGTYHLQKMRADGDARLVGVVELDAVKRAKASTDFDVPGFATLDAVDIPVDGAVIATTTSTHRALGIAALARGWHVLIEKPIAATAADGAALVEAAAASGRLLQVGHTERFNPAIDAALRVVDQPGYIVCERLGRFSGRSTDVDVVLDLMIHDLDIVATLVHAPLVEVRAIGVPVLTGAVDMAAARLAFADGTVAQLSAGRASLEPARKIRLFTRQRYVSIDCATRQVKSVRRLPADPQSPWPQITGEPIDVPEGDALALQDHDFVRCIIEGRPPRVDGAAGLRALQLAEAVKQAMTIPMQQPLAPPA